MTTANDDIQGLLILPHLRIQNANAISSPLTHGFPSVTALLGMMWALDREIAQTGISLVPEKVGVICHWHQEQVQDGYVKTFRLTRNPVDKDGSTAAIVEEGRIHLELTLVFQVDAGDPRNEANVLFHADEERRKQIAWQVRELVAGMRVAGGSVLPSRPAPGKLVVPQLFAWPDTAEQAELTFRQLRRQWLPGFALVGRDDLLQQRLQQQKASDPDATVLDAWLDLSRFNYRSESDDNGKVTWKHDRPPGSGWIVPIPVGYGALSPLYEGGQVLNARDKRTPFRFVESLYSIGQWISPHHLQNVRDLLWYADSRPDQGLYRCRNDYTPMPAEPAGAIPPKFFLPASAN